MKTCSHVMGAFGALLVSALPISAATRIVYVVPSGAGAMDGSSWEHAFPKLAQAYEALRPSGGEIWMAKGRYDQDATLTMAPNIVIRGGFAGGETRAEEANPAANPTIVAPARFNSGTDAWQPQVQDPDRPVPTTMWEDDGLTLVEPAGQPEDGALPYEDIGAFALFDNTDGADLGESALCGLWFHRYNKHVIRMTSANARPFAVQDCRFSACGFYIHNVDWVLDITDASIRIEGCAFIGCANPVRLKTSAPDSPRVTCTVTDCRFFACDNNWNCPSGCSGVLVNGNVDFALARTAFDRCRNMSNKDHAGALHLNDVTRDVTVSDCSFRRSVAEWAVRGAAVVIEAGTNATAVTFSRCLFEGNVYQGLGMGAHNSVGAAIGAHGAGSARLLVNDTAFVGNVVTNANYTEPCGSCVGLSGTTWSGAFANCLFEGNVSHGEEDERKKRHAIVTAWNCHRFLAFANCVFNGNRNGYVDANGSYVRQFEFRESDHDNEGQQYAFLNTVFANDDPGYQPWGTSWISSADFSFAACVRTSAGTFGDSAAGRFLKGPLLAGVPAWLEPMRVTNGVSMARGCTADSPYRRVGVPVYRATDGDLWLYDVANSRDCPWRLAREPDTVLSEADGAARGLSREKGPIPDFCGKPRGRFKTALGPIDFGIPGFKVLMR